MAVQTTNMEANTPADTEKNTSTVLNSKEVLEDATAYDTDAASSDKQDGIKQVEAITTIWSKQMLIVTFVLLWLVSFALALLSAVEGALSPYVTSAFSQHGLLGTISIAARIIGGVVTLFIGKMIDIRGRMEGFLGGLFLVIIGMIMKATCQNVETYAAAQVFYWVGHVTIGFVMDVFVADITTLRNRMLIFTLNSTPNLITTFAGPRIADLFYLDLNFRWAFGALTIILVGVSLPVIAVLFVYERKAKKLGLIREKSGRTTWGSIKYYVVQFDVLGMILIAAGFSLILLPFSLVQSAGGDWGNAHIIAMIVVGFVCLGLFVAWERLYAPVMFFPFELLKDRTVLGAGLVYFIIFLSTFIWNGYYSSYLQVVNGLSITISNYVLNAYSLTSYFTGPFIALYIRYTGHVKWPAMAAVPIYLLSTGLLIYFRHPGAMVNYLAMCQVLVGFSVGMLTTMSQLALMASVRHQDVAVALAIYGLFGAVGSSTGYAVAGGLWTNMLPGKILYYLPEEYKDMAALLYGDIEQQMAEPIGHPIRDAVIHAYGDVMRVMTIAGSCLIPLLFIVIFMWKNINVKKMAEQEKKDRGNVF